MAKQISEFITNTFAKIIAVFVIAFVIVAVGTLGALALAIAAKILGISKLAVFGVLCAVGILWEVLERLILTIRILCNKNKTGV
jgi:hypothetical protein